MQNTIILASASPRRKELLHQVGLSIEIIPSQITELGVDGESPEEHVIRLSLEKAREVSTRDDIDGRWVIGSDTIVLLDDSILGKPIDSQDAQRMLRALSGRTHRVLSGYAILDRRTGENKTEAVSTRVSFRSLTDAEITGYIATGEPTDKAGSYAIQGLGAFMVKRIEGSYTNVVGLPLCEVVQALETLGAPVPVLQQST